MGRGGWGRWGVGGGGGLNLRMTLHHCHMVKMSEKKGTQNVTMPTTQAMPFLEVYRDRKVNRHTD